MTNKELKEKICNIIAPYVSVYGDDERIADALIAAGLTFDKTTAILAERTNGKTLILKAQYYDQMKHRAEVAERALEKFAENITCEDCPFFSDCASSEKMGYSIHSYHCFSEYLKQAEKKLAEEGEDD